MAKSMFHKISENVKKKRVFMLSVSLINKLEIIEIEAEKNGISFPLNMHVEEAIKRLVKAAEKELNELASQAVAESGAIENDMLL